VVYFTLLDTLKEMTRNITHSLAGRKSSRQHKDKKNGPSSEILIKVIDHQPDNDPWKNRCIWQFRP
jgi:hypothetical protein